MWLIVCGFGLVACAPPAAPTSEEDGESTAGTSTGGEFETPEADDSCTAAPEVVPGRWQGTLRDAGGEQGGACGAGGRDAFLRVAIPQRADLIVSAVGVGYVPRLSVSTAECAPLPALACSEGLPLVVHDLRAGSEMVVTIGADPEDTVFENPSLDGVDQLAFAVDLDLRLVLGEGAICLPVERGRCAGGTACLVELENGVEVGRCRTLAAENCATAEALVLAQDVTTLEFEIATPHRDDHFHGCTGHRMRDRVYRLALDSEFAAELGPDASVRIAADDPEVALALRGPGCLPTHELACAPPELELGVPAEVEVGAHEPVFLFVEWPEDEEGVPAMLGLTMTVVDA
jgi:hypothetical protein